MNGVQPQPQSSTSVNALPVAAHLLGLFTGFLGPLILYLAVKEDPAARRHASAALNWQLSLLLYLIGSGVLLALAAFAVPPILFLFFLVFPALFLADLVVCIVGAVNGGNGQEYRYPATIPFTKP